jgi:hypothetical protein
MVEIVKSKAPITSQDLDLFEASENVVIPKEYREFLLSENGRRPKADRFLIYPLFQSNLQPDRVHGEQASVAWFFAINSESENLGAAIRTYKDRLPGGFFPFARDPGGNIICLGTIGETAGLVYFWDHEREADPDYGERPSMRNVYYIAPSFQEFLDGLTEREPHKRE